MFTSTEIARALNCSAGLHRLLSDIADECDDMGTWVSEEYEGNDDGEAKMWYRAAHQIRMLANRPEIVNLP